MAKSPSLIGSAQAARVFGVDRATFNRWVKAERIPVAHAMDGDTGARLFDAAVIDRLAEEYAAGRRAVTVASALADTG